MDITREDRVRMERAHVHAWPARRSAVIDGWLWRCSGGGSQRANSVSTIDYTGNDPVATLERIEARYRAENAAPRFQCFDATSPTGLEDLLHRRGYRVSEPTITMFKPAPRQAPAPLVAIETTGRPTAEWQGVYLDAITENRRSANSEILGRIPAPCGFFTGRHEGIAAATALGVVSFGCAVIECVATRADRRRQGLARGVLSALETWAAAQGVDWIGLQVTAGNRAAIQLYEQLGYQPGATNRFWAMPTDPAVPSKPGTFQ